LAWALLFLLLVWIEDTHPISFQAEYDRARLLFERGYLEKSQQEANLGFISTQDSDSQWAAKFRLLKAESMLFRGM